MNNKIPITEPAGPDESFVEKHLNRLQDFVDVRLGTPLSEGRAGDCEIVSSFVKEYFDALGVQNKIYGGDIPIGPGDYLSHRINFVYDGDSVWVIDLTSRQLPLLSDSDWVMEKIRNEPGEVWAFMDRVYPGWA